MPEFVVSGFPAIKLRVRVPEFVVSGFPVIKLRQVKMELFLLQSHLPFAVVGSNDEVKIGNKMVKARQYPWGTVQGIYVWNPTAQPVRTLVANVGFFLLVWIQLKVQTF